MTRFHQPIHTGKFGSARYGSPARPRLKYSTMAGLLFFVAIAAYFAWQYSR